MCSSSSKNAGIVSVSKREPPLHGGRINVRKQSSNAERRPESGKKFLQSKIFVILKRREQKMFQDSLQGKEERMEKIY